MVSEQDVTDIADLWDNALEVYKQDTKTDLLGCDFADELLQCTSTENVLEIIHNEMDSFKAFRAEESRWGKVRAVLKRVVDVVLIFNDAVAETGASHVRSRTLSYEV